MRHTLLLSNGYEPLKIISWKKAIVLVFLEKVEVVEAYAEKVRAPSAEYPLPAVVRLHRYVRYLPQRVKFSRQNLFFRDNYTCQYCHKPHPPGQLTYDHVVPRSFGGQTSWTNIVTACKRCNHRKGNKHLHQVNFKLLRDPVEPKWMPLFSPLIHSDATPPVWREYLATALPALAGHAAGAAD
jgi:5-methylcytosine-specific restriction endonuclease McrA